MIDKILKVARREYLATVRSKTFLMSLLLVPVIVGGSIFLSTKLQKKSFSGPRPDKNVAVVNHAESMDAGLDSVFAQYNVYNSERKIVLNAVSVDSAGADARIEELKQAVRTGGFDALLVIDGGVVDKQGSMRLYTKNQTDINFPYTVQRLANDAVFNTRLKEHDLSPALINQLRQWVTVDQVDLGEKTEKKRNELAILMVPFFFLFLMFFGTFAISQGLLMSVIEEKTSRVIEVLLASISPFELMTGKILGQAAVGFTLIGIYGAASFAVLRSYGMGSVINGGIVGYFIVYFILGFLVISSILAAIGSVCNDIKEAQGLMTPFMIIMVLPMMTWVYIVQHPEGWISILLSFIPPMTPMIMIMRIAAAPTIPLLQIAGSIALLLVTVPAVFWAASKVFHTGILMYGKPPTLKEIIRWVK